MIQKSNVTEQLVAYYKQQILSGNWKVGEKIPSENQLSAELGVSRASIRSAVKELVGTGILESVHGKGTYLIDDLPDARNSSEYKITADDCRDMEKVLEFRRILEPEACCLAAGRLTGGQIEQLRESLEAMKRSYSDSMAFVAADLQFHRIISESTGNPLIAKSMHRIFEENFKDHEHMNQVFGYQDGIYYHSMILEAVRKGDGVRAGGIMYDHLQHALDRLKTIGD